MVESDLRVRNRIIGGLYQGFLKTQLEFFIGKGVMARI